MHQHAKNQLEGSCKHDMKSVCAYRKSLNSDLNRIYYHPNELSGENEGRRFVHYPQIRQRLTHSSVFSYFSGANNSGVYHYVVGGGMYGRMGKGETG